MNEGIHLDLDTWIVPGHIQQKDHERLKQLVDKVWQLAHHARGLLTRLTQRDHELSSKLQGECVGGYQFKAATFKARPGM